LQWFLSESGWDPQEVDKRRLELLLDAAVTIPEEDGFLMIEISTGSITCSALLHTSPSARPGLRIALAFSLQNATFRVGDAGFKPATSAV
jgi:hypothetical protein